MILAQREFNRYGLIVGVGLGLDLVVANLLHSLFGVSLEFAAAIGVVCGGVWNYIFLNAWAFAGPKNSSGVSRAGRFILATALTMLARSGCVWLLANILIPASPGIMILIMAVVFSFILNFLLSKYWVFRTKRSNATRHRE